MKNSIVEEIREIRDAHAAKFQFDLRAICEDLRKKENTCGHPVVSLPPKRILKKPIAREYAALLFFRTA